MLDIEAPLKHLLQELKGMRSDLKEGFAALAEEVRKVNVNLEGIANDNRERFRLLHPELKDKPDHERRGHSGHRNP